MESVGTSDKPALSTPGKAPGAIGRAARFDRAAVRWLRRSGPSPIFLGDSADGADLLNAGQIVQPLAHLCVTPQVQTPFLAAILGPSGAGKTFALEASHANDRTAQRFGDGERAGASASAC